MRIQCAIFGMKVSNIWNRRWHINSKCLESLNYSYSNLPNISIAPPISFLRASVNLINNFAAPSRRLNTQLLLKRKLSRTTKAYRHYLLLGINTFFGL